MGNLDASALSQSLTQPSACHRPTVHCSGGAEPWCQPGIYVTPTTVRRPENSDTWTSNWALSMPGLCPRNYFAPTARSRWAVDCLSQQQRQKSGERGLPSQFFPLAKLFVEMSRQMLERVCKRDGVGRNCLWKLLLNHTRS